MTDGVMDLRILVAEVQNHIEARDPHAALETALIARAGLNALIAELKDAIES